MTGGEKSRYGIGVLMYSTILSSGFLFAALICKLKRTHGSRNRIEAFNVRSTMALQLFNVPDVQRPDEIYHEMQSDESLLRSNECDEDED